MIKHNSLLALSLAAALLLLACGGDSDPNPNATIIEFSPESLDPLDDTADDLTIRVEYADGDGDLGEGTAIVHDCRVSDLMVVFELPPIASAEAVDEGVPIEGTLELIVADVSALAPASAAPAACTELGVAAPIDGEAIFCVVLVDAAGNSGTGDCTGSISIQ